MRKPGYKHYTFTEDIYYPKDVQIGTRTCTVWVPIAVKDIDTWVDLLQKDLEYVRIIENKYGE